MIVRTNGKTGGRSANRNRVQAGTSKLGESSWTRGFCRDWGDPFDTSAGLELASQIQIEIPA
jgi:hypothetical protein